MLVHFANKTHRGGTRNREISAKTSIQGLWSCSGCTGRISRAFTSGDEIVRKVEGWHSQREFLSKKKQDLSEADDKKTLLVGLTVFVTGKPPPLEGDTTVDKPAKVKVEPLNSTEKETQEAQGVVDVSKVLRREFKIHGVVAGDNFKDGLSFASLAQQIESGIKVGFKETEMVEAVIHAVSPSLKVRSYLQMIQDAQNSSSTFQDVEF